MQSHSGRCPHIATLELDVCGPTPGHTGPQAANHWPREGTESFEVGMQLKTT